MTSRSELDELFEGWTWEYGAEYVLDNILSSMSTDEMLDTAKYFARMHDDPYFDEDEEEEED